MLVMPPEMFEWGIPWLAAKLAARPEPFASDVVVSDREPSSRELAGSGFPRRLVILGDSGSSDGDLIQADFTLRVSTLAGTPDNPKECNDLARLVHALFRNCAGLEDGNPVAAVTGARGPMWVAEQQFRARRMSLFDLSVVGDVVSS